ncbi:MAG: hypothetical protein ACR2O8_09885 [Rhizobiaceae bacterium]
MALARSAHIVVSVLMLCMPAAAPYTASAATKELRELPSGPQSSPHMNDVLPAGPSIPKDALPDMDPSIPTSEPEANAPSSSGRSTELPTVLRDLDRLPAAVRKTHEQLLQAAKNADIEALRSLIGSGETATSLSIGGLEGDPIEFLKETSGDADGYEVLAILLEVLEAGFVHVDAGTENEMYVWPYFFAWPFDKLTPQMKVELFRILTAGDVEDSRDFGGYIFYRAGIRPNGQWDFFVAGD